MTIKSADGPYIEPAEDLEEGAPLWIVTATTRPDVALGCIASWIRTAARPDRIRLVIVWNNSGAPSWNPTNVADTRHFNGLLANVAWLDRTLDPLGTVPAFHAGVEWVWMAGTHLSTLPVLGHLVCCFHDDLEIFQYGWDDLVRMHFNNNPRLMLAGFFGAKGLGRDDIYQEGMPYDPHQLVRQECFSNLVDGELHGKVVEWPVKCAVLDGFSAIMRAPAAFDAWTWLHHDLRIVHHAYDAALGGWTALCGGECWMLPVKCKHYGGRTAVGDPNYEEWARRQGKSDALHWQEAHRKVWEWFRDHPRADGEGPVLPLRVG